MYWPLQLAPGFPFDWLGPSDEARAALAEAHALAVELDLPTLLAQIAAHPLNT